MLSPTLISSRRDPWNKGALVRQKAPLKLRDIWAIRVRLELIWPPTVSCAAAHLVQLHLRDVAHGDRIAARTIVMQQKPSGRCSSKSRSRSETRSSPGFGTRHSRPRIVCFQAGYGYPPFDPYPTIKSGSFGAGSSTSLSVVRARCGDKHS